MQLSKVDSASFQEFIWDFYSVNKRQFAWRNVDDPYLVVVSEIMLQQTQTYRVEPKFDLWIGEFPDFASLAQASLRDVLSIWQGLGYNRRAMALQKIAQRVMDQYNGQLPDNPAILETFSAIGPATAASICAFAFNQSMVFIETNIRTVFIHTFFKNRPEVADKEIYPLVEQTLDLSNPRDWYYALMDYGVALKKQLPNPNRKSKHYTKQSRFDGSDRQIRGMILRELTKRSLNEGALFDVINKEPERVKNILQDLVAEKFIIKKGNAFHIA